MRRSLISRRAEVTWAPEWVNVKHEEEDTMRLSMTRLALGLLLALAFAAWPAAAQTWVGPGTDWNTGSNWSPAFVPNSSIAAASFTGSGLGTINLSTSVETQSLSFSNSSGGYTLTSSAGVSMVALTTIVVGTGVTGTETINLANVSSGSLQFSGNLIIANNSASPNTTLVIGANTVLGSLGTGGVVVDGAGVTQISGSFAAFAPPFNPEVKGGLNKAGPGRLIFSGNGSNLRGGLSLSGGTLELNYATDAASKIGGSVLTLSGGVLSLVANPATPVTQTVGGTTVAAAQTDVVASSAGGGTLTLAMGAVTHSPGGTLDGKRRAHIFSDDNHRQHQRHHGGGTGVCDGRRGHVGHRGGGRHCGTAQRRLLRQHVRARRKRGRDRVLGAKQFHRQLVALQHDYRDADAGRR
jgi:autotransporter-associated beta strand protein